VRVKKFKREWDMNKWLDKHEKNIVIIDVDYRTEFWAGEYWLVKYRAKDTK